MTSAQRRRRRRSDADDDDAGPPKGKVSLLPLVFEGAAVVNPVRTGGADVTIIPIFFFQSLVVGLLDSDVMYMTLFDVVMTLY